MNYLPEWPNAAPSWTDEALILLDKPRKHQTSMVLKDVIENSDKFPIKFPIETVRCKTLKTQTSREFLEKVINSAYPLIHENVLLLCAEFLIYKKKFGSVSEKRIYKYMTVLRFIERLLAKRAVMFMGKFDKYILLDGTRGSGKWDSIGKDHDGKGEKLKIEDCLSYDEIKVSVFLSVSSYSYFINDGTRKNFGKIPKNRDSIQDEGVVIGLIGARLRKMKAMEYEEMIINKTQNTSKNKYGSQSSSLHSLFSHFYGEPCLTYNEMLDLKKIEPRRFTDLGNENYFDNVVFSKRIALSIDTLLREANHRAKNESTTAYVHVVGIGLGVWKCSPHQEDVFVETFIARLRTLSASLHFVSDVYFSYFNSNNRCGNYKNGDVLKIEDHCTGGIKIHIGKRDPHTKLIGVDAGKLLIVSYAWDGNSLPGNEFWDGKLGSTGDSAAASSTQISEIHNPHINPNVCAENLYIVTSSGLQPYAEYYSKIKSVLKFSSGNDLE